MAGSFHIENIEDITNDGDIFYYDVWFAIGNLTLSQWEILNELNNNGKTSLEKQADIDMDSIIDLIDGYARIIRFENFAVDVKEDANFTKSELNKFNYMYEGEMKDAQLNGFGRSFKVNEQAYMTEIGYFATNNLHGKGIIWDRMAAKI
jgi:hypothetical protein